MSAICKQDIIEELLELKTSTIRGVAYIKAKDIERIIKILDEEDVPLYSDVKFKEDPDFKFKEADPNDDGQIMHPYKDY